MVKVLFVCLGNICRSSAAEGILRKMAEEAGLSGRIEADSAGLESYHQGQLPDPRMRRAAARRGYELTHRSRPVTKGDLIRFDRIYVMDRDIEDGLLEMAGSDPGVVSRIFQTTDYCRVRGLSGVPDPYYGGEGAFEHVLDILEDACAGILESIARQ